MGIKREWYVCMPVLFINNFVLSYFYFSNYYYIMILTLETYCLDFVLTYKAIDMEVKRIYI
jgi:hypothetical protein